MEEPEDTMWWRSSVGYLIYLRSFADSTGNGIGDLTGVGQRLDHLADLGVDLLWVTPFFPSPMADFGYDVADYVATDPIYGSEADLDQLVADVHARDMRLIIDLVPNHTSIDHPWFRNARRDRSDPHRDYYIWADPGPGGSPPNNWVSYFGGSAWTLDELSGQYYLHLFLPEQPDLNWRSEAVVDEFDRIISYWLDRGVDGFRIDVAQALVKDLDLRSNPELGPFDPTSNRAEQWAAFSHEHDVLQPETQEVFRRWKTLCRQRNAFLIGETYAMEPTEYAALMGDDGLDAGFWFSPLHIEWNRREIERSLRQPLEVLHDPHRVGWLTSSQDVPRGPTRFGDGDLGRERSLLLSMLVFCLPGVPFLYQGEELGLTDGVLSADQRHDPVASQVDPGRDGCRTPMPWGPGRSFGFSDSSEPWLPIGNRTEAETAAAQRADDDSWLARYRRLVAVRHSEPALSSTARVEWLPHNHEHLICFGRNDLVVVANVGARTIDYEVKGEVLFDTHDRTATTQGRTQVAAHQGLVLRQR